MTKLILLDELILSIRIPAHTPDTKVDAIRAVLFNDIFVRLLRQRLRKTIRSMKELAPCKASLHR